MPIPPEQWLIPKVDADEETKLGWLRNTHQEGLDYLKCQRAFRSISRGLDAIADDRSDPSDPSLSRVRYNLAKRGIKEIVATLSNMRVIPDYRTPSQYKDQEDILNKRYIGWWYKEKVDRIIKRWLQWAGVGGKGYLYMGYERPFLTLGRPEIMVRAKGPTSVVPWQIGEDHDIQKAYAVDIGHEVPYFWAASRFPLKTEMLAACSKPSSILRRESRGSSQGVISNMMKMFLGRDKEKEPNTFPVCHIWERYTLDTSMNETGSIIHMGDPGTSWEYYVYPKGGQIPSGVFQEGVELMRPVRDEDAMLYPTRRCTWWCDQGILEDGPSHYAHGMVPIVPLQLDDWMSEFLGYPLTHDTLPLQKSVRDGLRVVDDSQNVRLRPPMAYDATKTSRNFMKSFDPRIPLQAMGFRGLVGDMKQLITPILPSSYYDVPGWLLQFIEQNEGRIDRILGVMDVRALAKAKQTPAGDTMEKMAELMGPIINEYSRNMDTAMTQVGEMFKYMCLQFDSYEQRLEILGPDGTSWTDYDYDPATLVPKPEETKSARLMTLFDRIREHGARFTYQVKPGSLHELTSLTRKLILFQFYKMDFPMDPWTVGEAFDLNMGPPPPNCNNILEKWAAWKKAQAKMAKMIQEEFGIPPQQGRGPKGGAAGKGGRSPSGNAPPQIKNRPSGDSTIQESR
jgi:hypothetical protein